MGFTRSNHEESMKLPDGGKRLSENQDAVNLVKIKSDTQSQVKKGYSNMKADYTTYPNQKKKQDIKVEDIDEEGIDLPNLQSMNHKSYVDKKPKPPIPPHMIDYRQDTLK